MIAFILVIVMFFVAYHLVGDAPNALTIVWLIMLAVLAIAKLVTNYIIRPKILARVAAGNGITVAQLKNDHPDVYKATKLLANKSVWGDLGSYFGIFFVIFIFRAYFYEPFKIPSGSMQPTLDVGDYIAVNKHYYRLASPVSQDTYVKLKPVERGDVVVFKNPNNFAEDWIKRVIGLPGDLVFFNQFNARLYIFNGCNDINAVINTVEANKENLSNMDFKAASFAGCAYYKVSYGDFAKDYKYTLNTTDLKEPLLNRIESLPTSNPNKIVNHQTLQYYRLFDYDNFFYKQEGLPVGWWHVPQDHYFMMGDNRDNSEDSRFVGFIPYHNIVGKAEYIWFSLAPKEPNGESGVNFSRMFKSIDGAYN